MSLQLISHDQPIEGIISLVTGEGKGLALRLSLKGFVFSPKEIESIKRLDDPASMRADEATI